MQENCEGCRYGAYDEEFDEYACDMLWDEDVAARCAQGFYKQCPYFCPGDDYSLVRHQN